MFTFLKEKHKDHTGADRLKFYAIATPIITGCVLASSYFVGGLGKILNAPEKDEDTSDTLDPVEV